MNPLKSISIRARMILALGLMLLLFAVFAFFSISEIRELGQMTSEIYEHPLRVSNAALGAETGIIRMHRGMKDLILAETSAEMHDAVETVRAEEEEVYRHLRIIQQWILGEEGKELIERTTELFAGWKPIRKEVQQLVAQGEEQAAARITREKGAEYVTTLERQMERLNRYAQAKADSFHAGAMALQSRLLRNTRLAILGVALLSLVIGYAMIMTILPDILKLRDTMAHITATGTLAKAEIVGRNEIAEMGRHFNAVVDTLENQFWLRNGQTGLSEELIRPASYKDLAKQVVNFVSRYTKACSAAIYACDPSVESCELKASYMFVEDGIFPEEFRFGVGIIGQVAADEKPILSRQAIPGALLSGDSAHSASRNVYAIPLIYENQLHGVLAIVFCESDVVAGREFVDIVGQWISTALFAAAQKERIEGLLKTTRQSKEQLEVRSDELRRRTDELNRTSKQLQRQNAELEKRGRDLEEANRLQAEFMSNISHELRTPLNSVMALSRVLKKQADRRGEEEEEGYLRIIERNGQQLLEMIDDILDLAKIESGRFELNPKRLSLRASIDSAIDSIEPLAEEKGLRLEREIADGLPDVVTDEKCFHHILRNLLSNAVKFTDVGCVTVSARQENEAAVVEVSDSGIGIPEPQLPHVFDRFWQADVSLSSNHEGAGLGLTISYETAKMIGGTLGVVSRAGEGSTFTLRLPFRWTEEKESTVDGAGDLVALKGIS